LAKWFIKNRYRLIFAILVLIVVSTILSLQFPGNQLPTEDELQSFINEKEIIPIFISNIGNSYSIILADDAKYNGTNEFIVYKNRRKKLKVKQYDFYESSRANTVDVEYWGQAPYGYNLIGFVGIEIRNDEIASKAKTAKVIFDNGSVEYASFDGSKLLLIPATRKFFWEKPRLETIEIYDVNGVVLHGFYTNYDKWSLRSQ
jgi:hypothetical protein